MDNAYTVEPAIYLDENGQEQLSYDHAQVKSSAEYEQGVQQFHNEEHSMYMEDEEGELSNIYANELEVHFDEEGYQGFQNHFQ